MQVKKENRVLTISEQEKNYYLKQGYDVVEVKNGKFDVVEPATGGRTYSIAEYNAVVKERDDSKEQIAKLEAENKALKKQVKESKKDTTDAAAKKEDGK